MDKVIVERRRPNPQRMASAVIPVRPATPSTLTAKTIKTTLVLDPNEVASIPTPEGKPRCIVRITVAGRTLTADLNAKSVRKAIATIREAGSENVACILQGKLMVDNSIAEAGLSAQPKVAKPAEAPAAG
jgi:hypothetical protein